MRDTIRFEVEGPVATVVLDRPEVHNAYSTRMRDELHEVFSHCRDDDELRVVVIRAEGRSFCAGADLDEFGTAPSPFEARRIRFARDVWGTLRAIPVPVIAVLHGHAIGSGLELALLATLRIAARSTRLRMPEAQLGLLPAACGTQTLTRLAGPQTAGGLLLLGRDLDAGAARAAGLLDLVVDDDELAATTARVVDALAARPRPILTRLTRLLKLQDELSPHAAERAERLHTR
ncbi:MAG TPA: enoyl-CoA hydratase/isomerase family protein [Solirubrobacter sp.]|nr:enoyl-CoA hydratase/isomerase family protein [Solirubrobacter sp.]